MRLALAILAAVTLAMTPAVAEKADKGKSSARSKQAVTFAKKAAIGNLYEIRAGRLALKRARRADVKRLAGIIVEDHEKARSDLKSAIGGAAARLPSKLDKKHARMLKQLRSASARRFDRLYLRQQASAHQEAISLFRGYAKRGGRQELKEFARNALPTLVKHRSEVRVASAKTTRSLVARKKTSFKVARAKTTEPRAARIEAKEPKATDTNTKEPAKDAKAVDTKAKEPAKESKATDTKAKEPAKDAKAVDTKAKEPAKDSKGTDTKAKEPAAKETKATDTKSKEPAKDPKATDPKATETKAKEPAKEPPKK